MMYAYFNALRFHMTLCCDLIILMGMGLSCLILAILVTVQCKVIVENLDGNFEPKNELDYVNYLKLMLDRQDSATTISKQLAELAATTRPEDVIDRVVIAFIPYAMKGDKHQRPQNGKEIQFKGKLLQELVFETPQLFIITSLPASEEARLHLLIQAYKKDKKIVHVIRGQADEVRKLGSMLNMEEPQYKDRIHHPQHRPNKSPFIARPSQ